MATLPTRLQFAPPLWAEYDRRCMVAATTALFARVAIVNRFQARYRFARAFRGLNLEGYSLTTAAGYDALTKVSLHWSAFESACAALRIPAVNIPKVAANYDNTQCLADLRRVDPEGRFFTFVREHLDGDRHRAQIADFLDGEDCSPIALVKAVRHIFLHGPLTPNASQVHPHSVKAMCDRLSRALMVITDKEFSGRVKDLIAAYP